MILNFYKLRTGQDPAAQSLLRQLKPNYPELTEVRIERVLRAEGKKVTGFQHLRSTFMHPTIEMLSTQTMLPLDSSPVMEVSYQRAITDPELDSILHAAKLLGVKGLEWIRLSTRYQFIGIDNATAMEITARYLLNTQVQTLVTEPWATLMPQGQNTPVESFDVAAMEIDEILELSDRRRLLLSRDELAVIKEFYATVEQRPARDGELEMIGGRWSDHCGHKNWRSLRLLKDLQKATARINHGLVVSAYSDNSGVMEFYDGWAICVKGETHISPTFGGSPYGGVMTKHGGVIRDVIFTGQGAYPIAGTTVMATCDPRLGWEQVPAGAFHPLVVLKESIRGTADYCNPMGIPMAHSQYLVHPRNWKGLALGHSVGILPKARAQKGQPRPGDFVVLIGGPTGIDGIHGATVSSGATTSETSTRDASHVQIGMPIEERKFMNAVPELRDNDCIVACTDCGAAGLSSAVGEMGESCGVWVNLAWIHRKCAAMQLWEIWLSESQERGVLAVAKNKLGKTKQILKRYGVPFAVIGVFTSTERCQVVSDGGIKQTSWVKNPEASMSGEVVVDLPYTFLDSCPLPKIEVYEPETKPQAFTPPVPASPDEWVNLVQRVLAHYNICDQSYPAHNFDQTVQGRTVLTYVSGPGERMPDELFVSAPLRGKPHGVGLANAVNQFYGDIDPAMFGRLMLASATAKLVAAGFHPSDITFCANVYTPPIVGNPGHAWRLEQLVRYGYAPGSMEIGIPVISGKDSSSGRFHNQQTGQNIDAPLTLDIMAMGRMYDVRKLIKKPFQQAGDVIVLFHGGQVRPALGGSILYDLYGQRGDRLPGVDLVGLQYGLLQYYDARRFFKSRSAIAEGGLIRRLFECCFGSGLGCDIVLPRQLGPLEGLFGELHGSILFTTRANNWADYFDKDYYSIIGYVTEQASITVHHNDQSLFSASVSELAQDWSTTLTDVLK